MRSTHQATTAADIKALRAEVERLGSLVKTAAKHQVDHAAGNVIGFDAKELRAMARNAGKKTRRFLSDTQRQAVDLRDEAEERITTHPFRAVGLAALSGAIIGVLFGRR